MVYSGLPRIRQVFEDFGTDAGPVAMAVLTYGALAFPAILLTALEVAIRIRRRSAWILVGFWLPFATGLGLMMIFLPALLKLVNDLN